jgi:hypothetical protein
MVSATQERALDLQEWSSVQLHVTQELASVIFDVGNDLIACSLIGGPLRVGATIPMRVSGTQAWSLRTVSLSVGLSTIEVPVIAAMRCPDGQVRILVPARVKVRGHLIPGQMRRATNPSDFDISTTRPLAIGDDFAGFFVTGPSVLSFEAASPSDDRRVERPWFTAFQGDAPRPSRDNTIAAWRAEIHRNHG